VQLLPSVGLNDEILASVILARPVSTVNLTKSIAIYQDAPLVGLVQVIVASLSCASPEIGTRTKPNAKPAIPAALNHFFGTYRVRIARRSIDKSRRSASRMDMVKAQRSKFAYILGNKP
jgi:hypothetical protein